MSAGICVRTNLLGNFQFLPIALEGGIFKSSSVFDCPAGLPIKQNLIWSISCIKARKAVHLISAISIWLTLGSTVYSVGVKKCLANSYSAQLVYSDCWHSRWLLRNRWIKLTRFSPKMLATYSEFTSMVHSNCWTKSYIVWLHSSHENRVCKTKSIKG